MARGEQDQEMLQAGFELPWSTVAKCIGAHASTTADGIIVVFLKGNISMSNY